VGQAEVLAEQVLVDGPAGQGAARRCRSSSLAVIDQPVVQPGSAERPMPARAPAAKVGRVRSRTPTKAEKSCSSLI
ncbi:hypothetical protein AB0M50_52445, partial [Nonomuraea fuscirosea]|uniref:hypothetical protein n=1 Tax=Nonomuraea fuscirosea TaxID=1291556 RepID=UPI0034388B55